MKMYFVRHYDSEIYTSVNSVKYVMELFQKPRPLFYNYLVYELVDTKLSFRDLTLLLPFDKELRKVSSLKLNQFERDILKYHLHKLREYLKK